jgi:hypothetical protein
MANLVAGVTLAGAWGAEPVVTRWRGQVELPHSRELWSVPLLRPPFAVMLDDGRPIEAERYCRKVEVVHRTTEYLVEPGRVEAMLSAGAALKLNHIELWHPHVAALARQLAAAVGDRVAVYGFVSPGSVRMLPPHRDPARVLVMQIEGRKRWRLDGPPDGPWSPGPCPPSGNPPTELLLEPGELLYLPYGLAHSAVADSAVSCHLTFTVSGLNVRDLRKAVLARLASDVLAPDTSAVPPEAVAGHLGALRHRLHALVDELTPATIRSGDHSG